LVTKKQAGVRLHAIMVRYTPAIISFIVLIPMVPALGFLNVQDPATWLGFLGFMLAGLVFVYDGLSILPEKGKINGLVASFVLFIIGGANIVFAVMIWFGWFNPFVGSSVYTPWATVTLALGTIALFISGTIELILIKMYNTQVKAKLS
jgi:hypothetical protein